MRIIVSGSANVGKSTFIDDFLKAFPNYRKSEFDYRKIIGDPTTHSKNTTVELQSKILNGMMEEIATWKKDDNVIMDRGPLDNVIYSLWCHGEGKDGFTDEFIQESFEANAIASNMIDQIIFIPITEHNKIEIVNDGTREVDPTYIGEIDSLFKSVFRQIRLEQSSPMFYPGRIPGFFEVFGSREERILIVKEMLSDSSGLDRDESDAYSGPEVSADKILDSFTQADKMAIAKGKENRKKIEHFRYLAGKYKPRK